MSTVNIGSALPAGSNTIGNVKIVDTGGTNQAAVDANNNLHVSLYQAANVLAIDSSNNAHVAVNAALPAGTNTIGNINAGYTEQAGLSAGTLNALLVPVTDVSNYSWWSLSIVGSAHVGQLSWEGSNDNFVSAAVGMYAYQQGIPSAYFLNATNVGNNTQIFHGPVTSRYFRVRQNAYTSGSVTGTLELRAFASFAGSINAIQTGTWTVQPGNTANTTAWKVDGSAVTQPVSGTVTVGTALPAGANNIGSISIAGLTATDPYTASVFAPGELRVSMEATQVFQDSFDFGLDLTSRWKSPVYAGGGVAAASLIGATTLGTGTTAGGYSYLESQTTFQPVNPGWLNVTMGNNIPYPYIPDTYLFWGTGTSPATPTTSIPLTDAAGFEIYTDGKMYAVMYQGGTRNVIQDLSAATGNSKQPTDASVHYYTMFYRGDHTYWTIDSFDNVVASTTTGAPGPNVNTLPLKMTAIAAGSNPLSSAVLTCNVATVSDTGRNAQQISDGSLPWRKATVKPGNVSLATTDSALTVGVHPSVPLPTGTNTLGMVGITSLPSRGGFAASVFAPGELRVVVEPSQLYQESFDTGLDTTVKWKTPLSGKGGIAALNEVADTKLGTGTSPGGWSVLESQPTFYPANPGWIELTMGNNIPYPYIPDTYFFWGLGLSPVVPTTLVPLTDAAGFEVAVGGRMFAVMYQGGTRNVIQDLSAATGNGKQPQDSSVHYYTLFYRGDHSYWCIDSLDNVVAQTFTGAPGPNVNTLPIKLMAAAGSGAPPINGQLVCNTVHVSDTTHGNVQLSDGTFPWRQATIDATGSLAVRLASNQTTLPVAQQASIAVSGTLQRAATVNGNGTTLTVLGMSTVTFTVTGTNVSTYLATVNFEGTEDGITWVGLQAIQLGLNVYGLNTTAVGAFQASCAGLQMVRARISGYTGGAVTVTAHAIPFPFSTPVMTLSGAGGKLTLSASSLSANADNPITFAGASTIARRIRIQNESAGTIYWDADTVASTGSASLAAPSTNNVIAEWVNVPMTTLHIWIPSGGTTVLNGTTGVKVQAWS